MRDFEYGHWLPSLKIGPGRQPGAESLYFIIMRIESYHFASTGRKRSLSVLVKKPFTSLPFSSLSPAGTKIFGLLVTASEVNAARSALNMAGSTRSVLTTIGACFTVKPAMTVKEVPGTVSNGAAASDLVT